MRLPNGMRDRIKKSAERSGRSMNAEILMALEMYFPPEPTLEEVVEGLHQAIDQAQRGNVPYRSVLIKRLSELTERLEAGLEADQFMTRLPSKYSPPEFAGSGDRIIRWRRVQEVGVEQSDLEREIERGMLRHRGGDVVEACLKAIDEGRPERALKWLRLDQIKFQEPEAAIAAIRKGLLDYYEENWGEYGSPAPWHEDDE